MDKISPIKERILIFIENQGITKANFTRSTNMSYANMKGKGLGSEIGGDALSKILSEYPNLSSDWLITGEGEMLKNGNEIPKAIKSEDGKTEGILLIPIEAMAGFGTGETQILEYECDRYVIPMFRDADFLIMVKGSSMYPKYNSGDVVACKKIPLTDLFFQWNKVYVLDTIQGALIKRIKKGRDDKHILLISENEHYEPFELQIAQIHSIALVVGVIRLE
jgi:phage repressor protein C with HTH and peptisase S24 domain